MHRIRKYAFRLIILVFTLTVVLSSAPLTNAADDKFELSIKSFPESYKPYLRQLHKDYPNWEFQPLNTGLDWNASVEAQFANNKSLVTASTAYTDIFRSREIGDYNYSSGAYIQKDGGFVRGNKLAVSYFMDPRNFLTEQGIFQFEKLSFDSSITINDVETALKGSFMYDTKISYYTGTINKETDEETGKVTYTSENKKKKTSKNKYSEVIYNAGKANNINPCYLVEKIINEVGTKGSNSVSGEHKTYPAVYNFYNIGAYDGKNALESGLAWAANNYKSGSYGRPWRTPEESINGGAEFIAENYINKGQYTSYLQRFNVDPNAANKPYTHQYMTNLSGAASPAYETYKAYRENGLLNRKYIFVIPIYTNMPAENSSQINLSTADGLNQTGKINTNCNVRVEPSTESNALGIQLKAGTMVDILDTVFTSSDNIDNIMRYPYWHKIKFIADSKEQTGYVYANFVSLVTQTLVGSGSYIPHTFSSTANLSYNYISDNVNVANVANNKVINFKSVGDTVNITAYADKNNFEKIKYKVVKDVTKYMIDNVTVTNITHFGAKVSFNPNTYFNSYEIFVTNKDGKLVYRALTTQNAAEISGLNFSTDYTVSVRGYKNTSTVKNYGILCGYVPFKTAETPEKPNAVTNIKAISKDIYTVALSWDPVINADGYYIYTYNESNKSLSLVAVVPSPAVTYEDKSKNAVYNTKYVIKAFKDVNTIRVYSQSSSIISYTPKAVNVLPATALSSSNISDTSFTLKWTKSQNATAYNIYKYNSSKKQYEKIAETTANTYNITGLKANTSYKFLVKGAFKVYDKVYESTPTSALTVKTAPGKTTKIYLSDVTTKSYKLNWKAVKGATGYRVYIYDSKTKTYKKYKSTTKTYMKFSKLSAGKKTYYKIMAYNKNTDKTLYGDLSSSFRATTKPAKVKNVTVKSVNTKSVKLSWQAAKGATGYRIYSYNSKKDTYKLVGKTTKKSITIKKLSPGKSYKFIVRAVSKTNNCQYYGTSSSKVSVTTKK